MLKIVLISILLTSCVEKIKNLLIGPKKENQETIEITMPPVGQILQEALKEPQQIEFNEFDKLSRAQQLKFDGAYIQEIFLVTRRIKISEDEYSNWMNVLLQGGTREGIYRGMTVDSYYRELENSQSKVIKASVFYTQKYMNQFLFQKFDEQLLEKTNIYKLKRIVCEKTLDLIDKLSFNREFLASWYALLSEDMALNFPGLFQSDLRKKQDKMTHFLWASRMPLGHIKSEVLVKLHKIYNLLNQI